jgi:hypothetical protein
MPPAAGSQAGGRLVAYSPRGISITSLARGNRRGSHISESKVTRVFAHASSLLVTSLE